jgi:hypothetical protein
LKILRWRKWSMAGFALIPNDFLWQHHNACKLLHKVCREAGRLQKSGTFL